jgi:hypothetical protein
MAKSRKELDKDLMFQKIMPALSDNPFSDLHGQAEVPLPPEPAQPAAPQATEPPEVSSAAPAEAAAPASAVPAAEISNPFSAGEADTQPEPEEPELPLPDDGQNDDLSALRSRLFSHNSFGLPQESVCTINVTEGLVRKNADAVMRRFNCCECDRCRCDVVTEALNLLPPHYVTGDLSLVQQYEAELPEKDITAALVRAVLAVRAHPKH